MTVAPKPRRLGNGCSFVLAVGLLFALLVFRSIGLEPFDVPSGSMEPTLRIGDSILVHKSAYGLRVPFTTVNVLGPNVPGRGDVVVFTAGEARADDWTTKVDLLPVFPTDDMIKRVVALPGEQVAVRGGAVWIDGRRSRRTELGAYRYVDAACEVYGNRRYTEALPGHAHVVLQASEPGLRKPDWGPKTVPKGHLFVLGDQRDRSKDSRSFGFVPISRIKGRATRVWMSSTTCEVDGRLPELRTQRIGLNID